MSAPAAALSHAPYGKTAPAMAPASTLSPAAAPLSEASEQRASEPSSPLALAQVRIFCMLHDAFPRFRGIASELGNNDLLL